MDESATMKVRLVDCVDILLKALWGIWRMSCREWSTPHGLITRYRLKKREMGTRKVIREHSTIGIVFTTDGSLRTPREEYEETEKK